MATTFSARFADLRSAAAYSDVEDIPLARPGVPDPGAVAHERRADLQERRSDQRAVRS